MIDYTNFPENFQETIKRDHIRKEVEQQNADVLEEQNLYNRQSDRLYKQRCRRSQAAFWERFNGKKGN